MNAEWSELTLGEFVRLQRGHDLTAAEQKPGSVPVMGSAGPNGTHTEAKASGPGVVIGRSGASMGRVHFCDRDYWPHNTCLYVTDFLGNDPLFVYYKLTELDLARYNSGSAQPSLNRNYIYGMKLFVPDPVVQRQISSMIRQLDDKIDLNRRINQTLEAMAQAIFKSWFVDFDPVKVKIAAIEQGEDPLRAAMRTISGKTDAELDQMPREQHDQLAATAALFPYAMEDSELGKIPKGWSVASIYEIANVIYGAPFASKLFNTECRGQPIVRIRDLRDEEPGIWTDEVHPKGYLITAGDIVVGMDGEFRAYLWGGESAWLNQRVCVFKPHSPHSSAFVRCAIVAPLAHIEATEIATTVIHLGKGDIDKFTAVVPDEAVAIAFAAINDPLYAEIVSNKGQMRQLSRLRDTLLPKLISGELTIGEVAGLADITGAI